MFILSSSCSRLEFWSVNHSSIYEISGLKVYKTFIIYNNWPNNLSQTNAWKVNDNIL